MSTGEKEKAAAVPKTLKVSSAPRRKDFTHLRTTREEEEADCFRTQDSQDSIDIWRNIKADRTNQAK
jgi:hypothetical protein